MRFALPLVALTALLAGCGSHGLPIAATLQAAHQAAARAVDPVAAITQAFTFTHSRPTHVGSINTTSSLSGLKVTPTATAGTYAFTATQVLVTRTIDFENDTNNGSTSSHPVQGTWSESTGVVTQAAS
jgi:hypothetical protein